jgi:hypothetical protein
MRRKKKFEILRAKNKEFYFVLKAGNGEIIATSETYKSKQGCKDTIKVVKRCFCAKVVDLTLES